MSDDITKYHEQAMGEVGLPEWANVKCPFCQKQLPLRSIRTISMRFNTRNFGDVTVEVFCDDCSLMDTVYFYKAADNISAFVEQLQGKTGVNEEPILEEQMYSMNYNNLVDKMIESTNKGSL